jgi:hypothetical protein
MRDPGNALSRQQVTKAWHPRCVRGTDTAAAGVRLVWKMGYAILNMNSTCVVPIACTISSFGLAIHGRTCLRYLAKYHEVSQISHYPSDHHNHIDRTSIVPMRLRPHPPTVSVV